MPTAMLKLNPVKGSIRVKDGVCAGALAAANAKAKVSMPVRIGLPPESPPSLPHLFTKAFVIFGRSFRGRQYDRLFSILDAAAPHVTPVCYVPRPREGDPIWEQWGRLTERI